MRVSSVTTGQPVELVKWFLLLIRFEEWQQLVSSTSPAVSTLSNQFIFFELWLKFSLELMCGAFSFDELNRKIVLKFIWMDFRIRQINRTVITRSSSPSSRQTNWLHHFHVNVHTHVTGKRRIWWSLRWSLWSICWRHCTRHCDVDKSCPIHSSSLVPHLPIVFSSFSSSPLLVCPPI